MTAAKIPHPSDHLYRPCECTWSGTTQPHCRTCMEPEDGHQQKSAPTP